LHCGKVAEILRLPAKSGIRRKYPVNSGVVEAEAEGRNKGGRAASGSSRRGFQAR
jgi:hypothetical protein